MIKVLVWQVSDNKQYLDDALKILERQHNGIELVGVTADAETSFVYEGRNVTFVPLAEVDGGGQYDLILVGGTKQYGMNQFLTFAAQRKLPVEKLLSERIVCIPGFTLEKYRKLQRSHLSIFSINCFGGHISHIFGMPFLSPFVNLMLLEQDFIKFLREPRFYMEKELDFKTYVKTSNKATDGYPLFGLGDIQLRMLHYKEADDALTKWNNRKHRINWLNLFVIMYTANKEILQQFDALPYDKKVCCVPFKSDVPSAWYINPEIDKRAYDFNNKVVHFGLGDPFYYDPFDMLLYGKKTQLIDM